MEVADELGYDNFNYSKVYGLGALDTREPL